jgi:hypothetical protein
MHDWQMDPDAKKCGQGAKPLAVKGLKTRLRSGMNPAKGTPISFSIPFSPPALHAPHECTARNDFAADERRFFLHDAELSNPGRVDCDDNSRGPSLRDC